MAPADANLLRGTALAEMPLGRWEAAIEHLRQAVRLDPRSLRNLSALANALIHVRRYPEARSLRLALAPANLSLIETKALTFLGEGDLASARAVLKAALNEVEPAALVAYMAERGDLVWVLDREEREAVLRLPPSAFVDKSVWGICLAQAAELRGTRRVCVSTPRTRERPSPRKFAGFPTTRWPIPSSASRWPTWVERTRPSGRESEASL